MIGQLAGTDLAVIVATIGVAAFVQAVAGFGFSLLAVPVMAVAVEPRVAVVVATGVGLVTTVTQTVQDRSDVDRSIGRRLILGAFAGMPVGLVLFLLADVTVLRVLLGITVLAAVVLLARGLDLTHLDARLDIGMGALSGVLATSLSTNGPPLVFGLGARRLPPERFRATLAFVLAVSGAVSLAAFAVAGRVGQAALTAIAIGLPADGVGYLLGRRARSHVRPGAFRVLVLALLAIAGVASLVTGLTG